MKQKLTISKPQPTSFVADIGLQKFIRSGLIVLVALMPFHAFLVILAGHLFGHMANWQAWKEILILLMLLAGGWQAFKFKSAFTIIKQPVNLAAITYIIIALLVSFIGAQTRSTTFWFGVKTDLVFISLFFLAQLVSTQKLKTALAKILLVTSAIVATLGLIQAWLLPRDFLNYFGYGAGTIHPIQLIDPAVSTIRIFSTLGGPNQLGAFLILPICVVVHLMRRRFKFWQPAILAIMTIALIETFSRSAWIGAIVAIAVTLAVSLGKKGLLIVGALITTAIIGLLIFLPRLSANGKLQYYVLHSQAGTTTVKTSNPLHIEAVKSGLEVIKHHPFGLGLGSAGPASYHGSNGFIPENYYIQMAVESGLAGLAAFLAFQLLTAVRLFQLKNSYGLAIPLLGTLVGVSLVNLLLHGWADSTLAYIYWILAGIIIGLPIKNVAQSNKKAALSQKINSSSLDLSTHV